MTYERESLKVTNKMELIFQNIHKVESHIQHYIYIYILFFYILKTQFPIYYHITCKMLHYFYLYIYLQNLNFDSGSSFWCYIYPLHTSSMGETETALPSPWKGSNNYDYTTIPESLLRLGKFKWYPRLKP